MPVLGKAGYSLIELLISMLLFAVATLGLSAGVAIVLRAGVLSDRLTRAAILAQDKLEELASPNGALVEGADTPFPGFVREWTVSSNDPDPGVSRVDVTVTWEGHESRSITLVTVVNE